MINFDGNVRGAKGGAKYVIWDRLLVDGGSFLFEPSILEVEHRAI